MGNYTSISIPMSMAKEIDKLITDHPEKGYRSRADVVIDLIRKRIEDKKQKSTKKTTKKRKESKSEGSLDEFTT